MPNESGEKVTGRRIKRVIISDRFIPMSFETGLVFEVTQGIPKSAKFLGWAVNPETNALVCFLEDKSFELIAPDATPPFLDLVFLKRQKDSI